MGLNNLDNGFGLVKGGDSAVIPIPPTEPFNFDEALMFTGNAGGTVNLTNPIVLPADFFVSFWYKFSANQNQQTFMCNLPDTVGQNFVGFFTGASAQVRIATIDSQMIFDNIISPENDIWYNFMFYRQNGTCYYLMNGISNANAVGLPGTMTLNSMGQHQDGRKLSGPVDEAGIIDRAPTPAEIAVLWNGGAGNSFTEVMGANLLNYHFDGVDGDTELVDSGGAGNTGLMVGFPATGNFVPHPTPYNPAAFGNCLRFKSNAESVIMPTGTFAAVGTPITNNVWFKPGSSVGSAATYPFEIGGEGGGSRFFFQVADITLAIYWDGFAPVATNWTATTEWHMFTATYNPLTTTMEYFLDGVILQSFVREILLPYGTGDNRIGSSSTGTANFKGDIDNVQVWNALLSDTDIANLWNDGLGAKRTDVTTEVPVLEFELNESLSASVTANTGSFGLDGQLLGFQGGQWVPHDNPAIATTLGILNQGVITANETDAISKFLNAEDYNGNWWTLDRFLCWVIKDQGNSTFMYDWKDPNASRSQPRNAAWSNDGLIFNQQFSEVEPYYSPGTIPSKYTINDAQQTVFIHTFNDVDVLPSGYITPFGSVDIGALKSTQAYFDFTTKLSASRVNQAPDTPLVAAGTGYLASDQTVTLVRTGVNATDIFLNGVSSAPGVEPSTGIPIGSFSIGCTFLNGTLTGQLNGVMPVWCAGAAVGFDSANFNVSVRVMLDQMTPP